MQDNNPENNSYTFYPKHCFIEALCAIIVLAILTILAINWDLPLDEMANPADTTYVPRPEWYFLFYFQLLKYFEGSLAILGIVIIPLIVLILLFLLPFYDKKETTNIFKRPISLFIGITSIVFIIGLTVNAIIEDSKNPRIFAKINFPPITQEQIDKGAQVFNSFCVLCHAMDGKGGFMAPDLTQVGGRTNRTYIENVIMFPQLVSQETIMSLIPLSEEERNAVSAFLSQKK